MSRRRAGVHVAVAADGALGGARTVRRLRTLERGQTVEAVIVLPVVLGVIFVALQIGIWAHARGVAQSGAHEGAIAASSYGSSESGESTASGVIGDSADGLFTDYSVSSSRTEDAVTVTVTGHAVSLVPMVTLPPIEQSSTVPIERYVPSSGGEVRPAQPEAAP